MGAKQELLAGVGNSDPPSGPEQRDKSFPLAIRASKSRRSQVTYMSSWENVIEKDPGSLHVLPLPPRRSWYPGRRCRWEHYTLAPRGEAGGRERPTSHPFYRAGKLSGRLPPHSSLDGITAQRYRQREWNCSDGIPDPAGPSPQEGRDLCSPEDSGHSQVQSARPPCPQPPSH